MPPGRPHTYSVPPDATVAPCVPHGLSARTSSVVPEPTSEAPVKLAPLPRSCRVTLPAVVSCPEPDRVLPPKVTTPAPDTVSTAAPKEMAPLSCSASVAVVLLIVWLPEKVSGMPRASVPLPAVSLSVMPPVTVSGLPLTETPLPSKVIDCSDVPAGRSSTLLGCTGLAGKTTLSPDCGATSPSQLAGSLHSASGPSPLQVRAMPAVAVRTGSSESSSAAGARAQRIRARRSPRRRDTSPLLDMRTRLCRCRVACGRCRHAVATAAFSAGARAAILPGAMSLQPSSFEMIARAHRVTAGFNARVRAAVAALPGNPGGITVARFGEVWATRCDLPGAPAWMNLLGPVSAADLDALPGMLEWYGELRPIVEVTPQPDNDKLARELAHRGAAATGQLDILRCAVAESPAACAGAAAAGVVEVSVVQPDDAMLFARTLFSGHVDQFHDHEAEGLASLVGGENMLCYLARVDGEPAAAAILTVGDGFAYLANASTLPAFRRRGCHNALLAARLRDAALARPRCETVIALAEVGSTSHRNMERNGLQPLVTLAQWTFVR